MPDKSSEAIGIIGSGPIGQGLATLWAQAGYTVQLGARSPESARRVSVPSSVRVVSFEEAARHKVVVLAVKHSAAQDVVDRLAPLLKRAMVFDVMNAAGMREGQIVSTLPDRRTEGQWMAEMLPDSVVVRAFSHMQEELLVSRAGKNPGVWAVGYATDALEERPRIESLLEATGYVPVFVGTLAESSLLDPGGSVFPHLFTAGDLQRLAAVHRLPRMLERFNAGDMSEVLHDKVQWRFPYGPTLGVQETFVGKEAVAGHLRRVRDSGVRISGVHTELETPHGAVVHAEGVFPTAQGPATSEIVSVVTMKDGLIGEVREYWDTAAIKG